MHSLRWLSLRKQIAETLFELNPQQGRLQSPPKGSSPLLAMIVAVAFPLYSSAVGTPRLSKQIDFHLYHQGLLSRTLFWSIETVKNEGSGSKMR